MVEQGIVFDKSWFVQSKQGNIKDEYYFEKKLGSGGYGAVYLAQHKVTSKCSSVIGELRRDPYSWKNVGSFLWNMFAHVCRLSRILLCLIEKLNTNNWWNLPCIDARVAVKAMQKKKITDYESFQNEINILMNLVSLEPQEIAVIRFTVEI